MLQLSFDTQKIDFNCFQGYKLAKKDNKYFEKNKSANTPSANTFNKK